MRGIEAVDLRIGIGLHVEAVAVLHTGIQRLRQRRATPGRCGCAEDRVGIRPGMFRSGIEAAPACTRSRAWRRHPRRSVAPTEAAPRLNDAARGQRISAAHWSARPCRAWWRRTFVAEADLARGSAWAWPVLSSSRSHGEQRRINTKRHALENTFVHSTLIDRLDGLRGSWSAYVSRSRAIFAYSSIASSSCFFSMYSPSVCAT